MIRLFGALAGAVLATSAIAGPPGGSAPPPDLSNLQSQIDAAVSALAGKAPASAIVPTCTTVPAMDTTNGSAGSGAGCAPPVDAARPTTVQLAVLNSSCAKPTDPGCAILTASDGTFSGVWPRAWSIAPGYAHAEVYGSSIPYLCMVVAATATAVNGKCFQVVTTALPGTLLALGSTIINPLSAASAGLTVRVSGRQ